MPRRLSWKTAVQRRNRPSSSCPSIEQPPNSNSYHLQQLNPYKLSSSLRNSVGASSHPSIQDGNYERNANVAPVRRSKGGESKVAGSFDSDSLGADDDLDNILSGISDACEVAADATAKKKLISADTPTCNDDEHDCADSCQNSSTNRPRPLMVPVDLGRKTAAQTKTGLHTSDNSIQQDENNIAGKILAVIDFDPKNNQDNDSEHNSLLEPIDSYSQNQESLQSSSSNIKLEPIEGRTLPSSVPLLRHGSKGTFAVDAAKMHQSANIFGVVHHHHNQPDDTISTVTDQTDSPFIFTYQKSNDDDSVSQITSSIAPSIGSLKNIPFAAPSGRLAPNRLVANRDPPLWMGGAAARTNARKRGAVVAGTFGRDRVRHTGTSEGGGGKSVGNADPSYHSNLDEIAYALNAGSAAQRPRRSKQDFSDLCTIDSEKSGVSRRRSLECFDVKSGISALGMGGASCISQSMTNMSGLSNQSSSRGLIEGLVMLARKAQHRATRFFFPTPPKVTQRKKFDRSDSLDDLLLEEGAKTLPHRRGNTHDDGKDDIDYFSRAMSTSSYGSHGTRSQGSSHGSSHQKPNCSRIFTCGTILLIPIALKIYNSSVATGGKGNSKSKIPMPNHRNKMNDVPVFHVQDFEERSGRTLDSRPDKRVSIRSDSDRDTPQVRHESEQEHFEPPIKASIPEPDRKGEDAEVYVVLENVADLDAGPFQKGIDVPFYWHVPRSGGGTINDVLGSCLELVLASDAGGSGEFGEEKTLRVVHFSRQLSFVNVDAYSPKGIQRAKSLNLVTSKLADVVMSPLLHDAATLFTPTHKGRMFTMLRNPIERAASLFYFIQDTQWKRPDSRNDQFADISIENFYKQGLAENNWMTRFLTNQLAKGDLVEKDLEMAKYVLKHKFLIGLLEEKAESFKRFQKYFGWKASDESCVQKKIEWTWPMKHRHVPVKEGSEAWNLINAQNTYDVRLYEYAKELFFEQQSLIPK